MKSKKKKSRPRAFSYLRFSTPEQAKGDSQRRQLDLAREYAKANGLDLDEALTFRDLGVSAWKGKNVQDGALGLFLEAVDAGRVPSGSWLLVENLDRLSRDKALLALDVLRAIVERDVTVVTLQDGRVYTKAVLFDDPMALMFVLMIQTRAHEESATKSMRAKAAWRAKRKAAQVDGTKITGRCPAWLKMVNGEFQVIEARADVVRQMYKLTLDGLGKVAIAKKFNTTKIPNFSNGNGWHPSYIKRILQADAVIGTFQPCRADRTPEGDPILDYYPAIVDKVTFLRVRELRRAGTLGGGRKGTRFSNLFGALAECGAVLDGGGTCGARMMFIDKGDGRRGLVCGNAQRGLGCKWVTWRYEPTEFFVLSALHTVEFATLYPAFDVTAKSAVSVLEDELTLAQDVLNRHSQSIATGVKLVFEQPDSVAIAGHLRELEDAKVGVEGAVRGVEERLTVAREVVRGVDVSYDETVTALREWLEDGSMDEVQAFARRAKLHQLLRQHVEVITFTAPPPMGSHHGDIRIVYHHEPEYQPVVRVDRGQRGATVDGTTDLTYPPISASVLIVPAPKTEG